MNIFTKIKNSIYSPKYYSEIAEKPFSYFFKYFLVFALLFALVFSIVVTIKFIPMVKTLAEKAPQLANYFPQDLKITIKDGKTSTSVAEPYYIKIPEDLFRRNNTDVATVENIIVIDTKNKFDIDKFNSYKTMALLTEDSIIYIEDGKISIQSLSSINEFSLNRAVISNFVEMAKPIINILYPIIFVGGYIAGYMVVIFKMFYLLFGALLIWAVSKINGLNIGYKKSYKLGMPLMTGAIIITSILGSLTFPFLFSIILIVSAMVNLKKGSIPAVV
ncbi:MAG: DUF1189 family protein [Candidatus Staskawiczbacteria bacterium]